MSDSSQGSGSPPARPVNPPKPAAVPTRGVTAPIRPKAPATAGAPIRPRAQSSHDHSIPEARRAREPLPEDATVPMRRASDRPPSMPAEDEWSATSEEATRDGSGSAHEQARDASPRPGAVHGAQVTTDAGALRDALRDALEPLQHALDDLTLKIARERVDRKEAVEKLERTVARLSTGSPPGVTTTPFAAATEFAPIQPPFSHAPLPRPAAIPAAASAHIPATQTPLPTVAQPYSVSPSAAPPPVKPVDAPAVGNASPAPPAVKSPSPPAVASPASIIVSTASLAPREQPVKYDLDPYSTDLSFDLPPGLDGSRRKKILGWFVFIVVVGGAIAMIASMIYSRSRGPGSL